MQDIPVKNLCLDVLYDAQVHLNDYQFPPFRRDRSSSGGEKKVYICKGIIAKKLTFYETQNTESICVEIFIKKRKWKTLFAYRPPNNNDLKLFFEETTQPANQLLSKFNNIRRRKNSLHS